VTVQATFVATLVDEWLRAGVEHAVIAPGSRSTPLALALAESSVRVHVHLDERAAGFFALGLGLASGRPAIVVTTSGTAGAHLHPAVLEAHLARVPMVVCTADRPPELHHVGAPQTLEQANLFGAALRWVFEPGVADDASRDGWRSIASRAIAEATTNPAGPGPVHLNLAFRDPLVAAPGPLPVGRSDGRPWHRVRSWVSSTAPSQGAELLSGRRGVVVAGRGAGGESLAALADALGWPVLAAPRSGLRGGRHAVSAFDAVLRTTFAGAGEARPEVVLRVGEVPASKVLAGWLAGLDVEQVVLDPYGRWPDPERTADYILQVDARPFCEAAARAVSPAPEGWAQPWLDAERLAQAAIDSVIGERSDVTEPGVARALTRDLPHDAVLFSASSMPIRDIEWYGHPSARLQVEANRGANGIDGAVSTALGLAAGGQARPVVALVGDLAFLHDTGGLLGAVGRPGRCTFVVLDNDGGGIFSFLPQASEVPRSRFEQLFGTPHGLDLAALAAVHGIPVTPVEVMDDLLPAVSSPGGVRVVHVRTDRTANVVLHDQIHQAVATALA